MFSIDILLNRPKYEIKKSFSGATEFGGIPQISKNYPRLKNPENVTKVLLESDKNSKAISRQNLSGPPLKYKDVHQYNLSLLEGVELWRNMASKIQFGLKTTIISQFDLYHHIVLQYASRRKSNPKH